MPESQKPIELNGISLAELKALLDGRRLPPVDQWDPPLRGHSRMCIRRDGSWFHDGGRIERPAMVRLFSTVLKREPDGRHVLVTPVEKLEIDVESTAFRAVEMHSEGVGHDRTIAFRLDSGDALILDSHHPLRILPTSLGPSPRLLVRNGLEAELSRSLYYELVELALAESPYSPGIWSSGTFFPLSDGE